MSEELTNNMPRLCHLRKWPDFEGYGFNLVGDEGKECQIVGSIDVKSPAELGGLKVGDRIIEVNGINVLQENHNNVVSKIKENPNEAKFLVVSPAGWDYYTSKNVQISGDLELIQHFESPAFNPHSSYYSKGIKKSNSHSISPLRLCTLKKENESTGYGFNLQTLENKPGKYVGDIDTNSPAHLGGIREEDRILKVNQVNVSDLGHREVVELIRSDPTQVSLLLVDKETDEYYKSKGVDLGIENANMDAKIVECSNTHPFRHEIQDLEKEPTGVETKFDDDDDYDVENININNNNNTASQNVIFSSSAAEARMKMSKKVKPTDSNLTLQDKYKILQGL